MDLPNTVILKRAKQIKTQPYFQPYSQSLWKHCCGTVKVYKKQIEKKIHVSENLVFLHFTVESLQEGDYHF